MECCPTEIWESIFQFACTDGGRTGLVLSRVSKHVRCLSTQSRFYTLVLRSASQLAAFLGYLESEFYSIESLPVGHLLLMMTTFDPADTTPIMYLDLLRILSQNLRSLTVFSPHALSFPLTLREHLIFPHLTELVLVSNNPDTLYAFCEMESCWRKQASLPKLRRAKLHFKGAMFKELFMTLVEAAPSLSLLEIVQPHIIRTSDLLIALKLFYGIGAAPAGRKQGADQEAKKIIIELETIRELFVGGLSWLHERAVLEQVAAQDGRLRIKPQRPAWSAHKFLKVWLDGEE
jgi:hypothetical protein